MVGKGYSHFVEENQGALWLRVVHSGGIKGLRTDETGLVFFHFNMLPLGHQGMVKLCSVYLYSEKETVMLLKDILQSGLT